MSNADIHFEVHPSSGVPIFRQIMDQVRALAGSGRLKAGDLLPSVRDVSASLAINMMTVSKAYARLETEGLLERVRGTGMRLRENHSDLGVAARKDELRPFADQVAVRALQLGLTEDQVVSVIRSVLRERRS